MVFRLPILPPLNSVYTDRNHSHPVQVAHCPRFPMQITTFLHAAILVSDLARSEHFYGTVLGLKKVDRGLKFPGAWYEIGAVQIHLIVATTVSSDLYNPEKWGRNRHLAFAVTDLAQAQAELLANGNDMQMSASGRAALFTQDPDGNLIEISELAGNN
jgi:glyoxylase I family protein